MHLDNEEKTEFMTDGPSYCYKVMPFRLKNEGATYQRLTDKIFADQMGRIVEVYVDDMVAKTPTMGYHCRDLEDIFAKLRRRNMRLNPKKCFGVKAGKFLGFMISKRGIEANPDKCRAIIDMRSPSPIKEVQSLARKITALSHFMSKAADKVAQFFECIKRSDNLEWIETCIKAFLQIKQFLATPPILQNPIQVSNFFCIYQIQGKPSVRFW